MFQIADFNLAGLSNTNDREVAIDLCPIPYKMENIRIVYKHLQNVSPSLWAMFKVSYIQVPVPRTVLQGNSLPESLATTTSFDTFKDDVQAACQQKLSPNCLVFTAPYLPALFLLPDQIFAYVFQYYCTFVSQYPAHQPEQISLVERDSLETRK